jgi:prophage antirepressor-like protein
MNNEQKVQQWESDLFGSLTTIKGKDGVSVFFIGKEVAEKLGYEKYLRALELHIDEDDKFYINSEQLKKLNPKMEASSKLNPKSVELDLGQRGGWIIAESGLSSLILSSKLSTAKEFKRWVTKDILPSLRTKGVAATEITLEKMIADPTWAIGMLEALKEEKSKRQKAESIVEVLTHAENTYTTTQVAKELNMSATKLNKILNAAGIIYKSGSSWVPYAKYQEQGLFESKQTLIGEVPIYHTKITNKGREFIVTKLTNI